jgi:hypothetical protein
VSWPPRGRRWQPATSEREALAKALAQGGGAALAEVRAEPGYERALAAALGDDLEAAVGGDGPRRWTGSASQTGDPPWHRAGILWLHMPRRRQSLPGEWRKLALSTKTLASRWR